MDRLTKRIEDENTLLTEVGDTACKCFCDNYTLSGCWECPVGKAIEKLADYEEAEEQGLLVRLPCKVGTEVFVISPREGHYIKCQIKKIEISSTVFGKIHYFVEPVAQRGCSFRYFDNEFGKTVFLTREEAEKRLEEIQNDKI